jgi:hypothetical protein
MTDSRVQRERKKQRALGRVDVYVQPAVRAAILDLARARACSMGQIVAGFVAQGMGKPLEEVMPARVPLGRPPRRG